MSLVHTFPYLDWFIVPDGMGCIDWDCDFYTLIIDQDMNIHTHRNNCENDQRRLEERFPHRFKHECTLSDHREFMDCSGETDKLKEEWLDLYERINRWTPFKDRRINANS